jgi:hypothetical protein
MMPVLTPCKTSQQVQCPVGRHPWFMDSAQCSGCRQIIVTAWKTARLQYHQHLPALQHPFRILFQEAKSLLYCMTHNLFVPTLWASRCIFHALRRFLIWPLPATEECMLCLDTK